MAAAPAERPTRTFSLRAHLLLLVIGTLLPTLIVAGFLIRRVVADNRDAVERRLLEAARAEAAFVDAELGGTVRALQGLGQSDRLTNHELDAFYQQAQRLTASQPTWSAVTLSTPDGRQLLNTSRAFGEMLPMAADRDSFAQAVERKTPAIGNLRAGQITGQLGFPVRVPVIRDGRVPFIVSAWMTSTSFAKGFSGHAPLSAEWVRGVVDRDGVLVVRSRDSDRFVGQKGTSSFLARSQRDDQGVFRDVALDSTTVYGAFSRAPISGWIAGVAVPASVVDAPFRQSLVALGIVALILVGIGGGGTYLISRRIATDISKSAAEAEAIAGGLHPSPTRSRVTELQRLLDALGRSAALLDTRERERDEQVARADAARADAEAADRAKDDFLAMLGHELRNPLAPALTALHLMEMRGVTEAAREREVLERQIRHMARLVDDLLDVSRLRRGAIKLKPERLDLSEAVAGAVEMTMPVLTEKGHHLDVDVPKGLMIDADRIRIAQVLSNLLSNAAKFTNPGGHVALRAREERGEVVIECRDDGIGMAAELVPRVFDLFVQGKGGIDRQHGGLGLGLAVARTLVELHGGTIAAQSGGPNPGSTFVVRLPVAVSSDLGVRPTESVAAVTAQIRSGPVMVVDDNHDALEMLLETMTHAGLDAFGAATSTEALDLAARRHPQVAVLDLGLPDIDGFGLARALRSMSNDAPLRLIALTGYGQEQDIAAARAAGFDAFFVKPVEIPALLDAVNQPVTPTSSRRV